MYVVNSKPSSGIGIEPGVASFVDVVSEEYLRSAVKEIALPRHQVAESDNNAAVADWIEKELRLHGLTTFRQGQFGNVVGTFTSGIEDARVIIGAHFDTVPGSPGADDNASAVAGMLAATAALSQSGQPPVAIVAFNREEDGLLGSQDFVREYLGSRRHRIELVHILEMIGYCDHREGSQKSPPGLPIKLSDRGDFLGIVSNRDSKHVVSSLLETASRCVPGLPVKALKVSWGIEKRFPHLLRSDHSPFWSARIPALMWTDTSEFRNPNYHAPSDLPETLDYVFLERVTKLLVAHVVTHLGLHVRESR